MFLSSIHEVDVWTGDDEVEDILAGYALIEVQTGRVGREEKLWSLEREMGIK